jgi:glutathione S-transferase
MASNIKPLKLYGGGHSPNPAKIAMIMDELQVPYETIAIPFTMVKEDNYTTINPNGRLPAIEDPNKGLFLWESGAIVEYLVSEYDSSNKLSFTAGSIEDYHTKQWLYFQVSGQGPYYGQYYVGILPFLPSITQVPEHVAVFLLPLPLIS